MTAADAVSVLLGRGDGTFDPPVAYDAPGAFDGLAERTIPAMASRTWSSPARPIAVPTPNTGLAAL